MLRRRSGRASPATRIFAGIDSTDEELDAFIRPYAITWFHLAGTAAMGAALDTECRVKGVENLRVVDVIFYRCQFQHTIEVSCVPKSLA